MRPSLSLSPDDSSPAPTATSKPLPVLTTACLSHSHRLRYNASPSFYRFLQIISLSLSLFLSQSSSSSTTASQRSPLRNPSQSSHQCIFLRDDNSAAWLGLILSKTLEFLEFLSWGLYKFEGFRKKARFEGLLGEGRSTHMKRGYQESLSAGPPPQSEFRLNLKVEAKKHTFSSFDELLANSDKPVLVGFYATWNIERRVVLEVKWITVSWGS